MSNEKFIEGFRQIPLCAISRQTRENLCASLNNEKLFTSNGYYRDWRGLTAVLNFTSNDFNVINQSKNQFEKLLQIWQKSYQNPNFEYLLKCFTVIGRFDVHDDVIELMIDDAKEYCKPIESDNVSNKTDPIPCPRVEVVPDDHLITKKDLENGSPQIYDVFIMYSEDDEHHLKTIENIVRKLEILNFSLCIKERDFLFGITLEHEAVLDMVINRCHRVLIFVSRCFLNSRYNQFLTQFCQKQSIIKGHRKLVPILLEKVELPLSLSNCTVSKYYKQNPFVNFDEILINSLKKLT